MDWIRAHYLVAARVPRAIELGEIAMPVIPGAEDSCITWTLTFPPSLPEGKRGEAASALLYYIEHDLLPAKLNSVHVHMALLWWAERYGLPHLTETTRRSLIYTEDETIPDNPTDDATRLIEYARSVRWCGVPQDVAPDPLPFVPQDVVDTAVKNTPGDPVLVRAVVRSMILTGESEAVPESVYISAPRDVYFVSHDESVQATALLQNSLFALARPMFTEDQTSDQTLRQHLAMEDFGGLLPYMVGLHGTGIRLSEKTLKHLVSDLVTDGSVMRRRAYKVILYNQLGDGVRPNEVMRTTIESQRVELPSAEGAVFTVPLHLRERGLDEKLPRFISRADQLDAEHAALFPSSTEPPRSTFVGDMTRVMEGWLTPHDFKLFGVACHRTILAARSPFFQGMLALQGGRPRYSEAANGRYGAPRDVSMEASRALVHYIYTGSLARIRELTRAQRGEIASYAVQFFAITPEDAVMGGPLENDEHAPLVRMLDDE